MGIEIMCSGNPPWVTVLSNQERTVSFAISIPVANGERSGFQIIYAERDFDSSSVCGKEQMRGPRRFAGLNL